MEWIVRRVCEKGKVIRNHQKMVAGDVRGILSITEEHDDGRKRTVRVARLHGPRLAREVPALHDVQLLASRGGTWSLAGYERIHDGALHEEHVFGQTWLLTAAPDEDLIRAESAVNRLAALLHEHGVPVPSLLPGAIPRAST